MPSTPSRAGVALTPRTTLQDETQRQETVAGQAPQSMPRPTPPSPASDPRNAPQAPRVQEPVRAEGPATPRGLENLRQEPVDTRIEPAADARTYQAPDAHVFHAAESTAYAPEYQEPMYLPLALSVGAGFKFGCGFMLALGVSLLGLFLVFSVLFFIASLAQIPLPGVTQ